MSDLTLAYVGAGLAIWLAGFGVAIWEWFIAKKSVVALGKNPDLQGTLLVVTILGIALTESSAIYGLIVALQILAKDDITGMTAIAAGLAVGLPGLAVGIGEWLVAGYAMDSILRNPEIKNKIMVFMILFIALVESSAIYGLIIALQTLAK